LQAGRARPRSLKNGFNAKSALQFNITATTTKAFIALSTIMALILVGTAAYAAYCVMSENEHPLDPEIPPLETLKSVSFLPLELALGLMEAPIHTISFFEGNYKEVAETLEQRIKDILFVNPWLGGWLCNENKELKLFFDDTSVKRAPGTFTLYEPGQISLTSDTAYIEYERILSNTNIKVPKNQNLLGKNEALWRISIIPDAVAPEERFALVASMSHIAGDACVFYKLYDMLSPKAEIVALNPERKQEVTDQVAQKMGAQEMTYATKAISNPLWDFTQGDTDPVQSSIFYVSDEWLERQRGGHAGDDISVSDHSLLANTFFIIARPTIAFNIRQLRGQVQDVSENNAGNYQVSIPYTEYDYASPELIEKSNTTLRRCGEYSLAALPGGSWNSTYSVMTNWSSFYTDPVSFGDGLKEVLHLPLYSTVELKDIPSKLSLFCVFTASQQKDDESHKRRIGASIVAPRSIVQAVEASGIVDEPISKC
jgi:hypothetical protein